MVVVAEEGLLPTVTPLGDVMGDAGGYDAGDTGHCGKIAQGEMVSIKYTVPEIRRHFLESRQAVAIRQSSNKVPWRPLTPVY